MKRLFLAIPIVIGSAIAPAQSVPVDLNGTYSAARNFAVTASTDSRGYPLSGHVSEAGREGTFTPFSDLLKAPAMLQEVDLRGKWFEFDADLGKAADWPNPDSTFEYQDGLAVDGHKGACLVVRAANSNGSWSRGTMIDTSYDNGIRIAFYRRDNKFWGHVRNTWYSWDIDLPHAATGHAWRVRYSHGGVETFNVTFTELLDDGNGGTTLGQSVTTNFAGGSTDYGGIRSCSFFVQLFNRTAAPVALPTKVRVSNFRTNAVANAAYAVPENAYVPVGQNIRYGLFLGNVTTPVKAYSVGSTLSLGSVLAPLSSGYFGGSPFNVNLSSAAPVGLNYLWSQSIAAGTTTGSQLVATADFRAVQPGVARFQPDVQNFSRVTASRLMRANGSLFAPVVLDSPRVIADGAAPVLRIVDVTQNGKRITPGFFRSGPLTVTFDATDFESGLEGPPQVGVLNELGELRFYPAGHMLGNRFQVTFVPSPTAAFLVFAPSAVDRSGQISSLPTVLIRS